MHNSWVFPQLVYHRNRTLISNILFNLKSSGHLINRKGGCVKTQFSKMFQFLKTFQFSTTFVIPEWPERSPTWTNDVLDLLLRDAAAKEPQDTTLEVIQKNSEEFPIPFGTQTVRCNTLRTFVQKEVLEKNINSVYPVLHENVLGLCANFLLHKRKYGHPPERELYASMTVLQLIQRLLTKRAVIFVGPWDRYLLLDKTYASGNWESIGTKDEKEKLILRDCLSYDEIKLSAFLSISSHTVFINDGNRYNFGQIETTGVESEGVIVGQIGPRLTRPQVMEYQEILISKKQNKDENGYGSHSSPTLHTLFSEFYGEPCFTYEQALDERKKEPNRFDSLDGKEIFDNQVYCKRIALSMDTFFLEANERAKEKGTMAFVHVVGIGLGAWRISAHQNLLFLNTCAKRLQILGKTLHSVSDVFFAYFAKTDTCGGFRNGNTIPIEGHPNGGIKIHIGEREPHEELVGEDKGKLLVVSYAWDGNALPGNDFWVGCLDSSGDPAAAASTQVAELHNPHINPKVSAENLRIATINGVIPFVKYCENIRQRI